MRAIVLHDHGGPDVLQLEDAHLRPPGPGEAVVEIARAGVNFMDVGVRNGSLWRDRALPLIPGVEGAGRVIELGPDVDDLAVGQRVAWAYVPGSYARRVVAPAAALVPLPDAIDDDTAAAVMLQGLTASHIATRFYETRAGDVVLVHAAAGGVGSLLSAIVKMRGGTVIGRVSSSDKVSAAKAAGADHVIVDATGRFAAEVRALTGGLGVHAVFDGSGAATFADSMASLRKLGTFAYFGPVLGAPPALNIAALQHSIKIGFPIFSDSLTSRTALLERSAELFDWIARRAISAPTRRLYDLADAGQAHADLEARGTIGKLLLDCLD